MNSYRFTRLFCFLCLIALALGGCARFKKQEAITHWVRSDTSQEQMRSDYLSCRRYAYRESADDLEQAEITHHREDLSYQRNMARYRAKKSYSSTLNSCMKRLDYRPLGRTQKKQGETETKQAPEKK